MLLEFQEDEAQQDLLKALDARLVPNWIQRILAALAFSESFAADAFDSPMRLALVWYLDLLVKLAPVALLTS